MMKRPHPQADCDRYRSNGIIREQVRAMSVSSEICRLHELHAAGILDDRDYARAKHQLLRDKADPPARPRGSSPRRVLNRLRRPAGPVAAAALALGLGVLPF
jgi:hypothetical protein